MTLTRPLLSLTCQFSSGGNPTQLISRVRKLDTRQGRQYELSTTQAGEMGLQLDNSDEALSPINSSSPYAGNVMPYKPTRLCAMWNPATLDTTGNILNDSNVGFVDAPVQATDGWFENGVGHWLGGNNTTIATSTTQHHSGTHSLFVQFITETGFLYPGPFLTVPTIPGQTYVASMWVFLPAATTPPGVMLAFGTNLSTSTSVTNTWTRLSVSYTALSYTTTLQLYTTAATTVGQNCYIDDVQVELGVTPTTFIVNGPTMYSLFNGYMERWPETFTDAGFRSDMNSVAVDAIATIGANKYTSDAYTLDVLSDNPAFYYDMSDIAGSTTFADRSGNGLTSLTVIPTSLVVPGAAITAGAQMTFGGDTYPAVNFNAGTSYNAASGICVGNDTSVTTNFLGYVQMMTISVVVQPSGRSVGVARTVAVEGDAVLLGYVSPMFALGIDSTGKPYLGVFEPYGGGWNYLTAANVASTTVPTEITLTYNNNTSTWNLYVNGVLQAGSIVYGVGYSVMVTLNIGGSTSAYGAGGSFDGLIAHVAGYATMLTSARLASHGLGVSSGYAGDTTATRFTRLLGWSGYTGGVSAPASTLTTPTTMQMASGMKGVAVVDAINNVVETENGQLLIDGYGQFTMLPRSSRYASSTVSWVLGENSAGGEIPYDISVSPTIDPQLIYNDISMTQNGGSTIQASNAASQSAYFQRTLTRTLYNQSASEVVDAANWFANRYGTPQVRIDQVTVDSAGSPSAIAFVLGVKQGDRVTIKRRLNNGVIWASDMFVEHVERMIDPYSSYQATVQMSPASISSAWVLDSSVLSVLDSTTVLAY